MFQINLFVCLNSEFRCRDLDLIYFGSMIMAINRLERDLRSTVLQKTLLVWYRLPFGSVTLVYLLLFLTGH